MDRIEVGVTGTGSLIGQAVIKSLLKCRLNKKIDIIGFDYVEDTVGSYWVKKHYLLPDILNKQTKESGWLETILKYINKEGLEFIFIGIDFELKLFGKYKQVIENETGCRVIISDPEVIRISDDKYLTYNFLKDNGLAHPKTILLEEPGFADMDFPCILKPRFGTRSEDVFIVKNRKELKERAPLVDNPIIQELVGDKNTEYTCGTICFDGSVKQMIALKRILKDGHTVTASFNKDAPRLIYDYVCSVADKLKPFGPCNFQLRLDNEVPKLFEINARHSGTTYIRTMFGFNEVEFVLAYLLGLKPRKFKLREGKVKRYYGEMFIPSK